MPQRPKPETESIVLSLADISVLLNYSTVSDAHSDVYQSENGVHAAGGQKMVLVIQSVYHGSGERRDFQCQPSYSEGSSGRVHRDT